MSSPPPGRPLDQVVAELLRLVLESTDLQAFLDEVAWYAAEHIGTGLSCGITMDRGAGAATVACSDPRARVMDEVQYDHRVGPCLTAMRTGATVHIPDLGTDTRWGPYRRDALAHGVGSALSVGLDIGPGAQGALNFYAARPHAFGDVEHAGVEAFGVEVSRVLRLALRLSNQVRLNQDLRAAMASRSVIDQAIGIVMSRNRCSADAAFGVLRVASNHRNVKLRDVAADVVARVAGHPAGGDPADPGPPDTDGPTRPGGRPG